MRWCISAGCLVKQSSLFVGPSRQKRQHFPCLLLYQSQWSFVSMDFIYFVARLLVTTPSIVVLSVCMGVEADCDPFLRGYVALELPHSNLWKVRQAWLPRPTICQSWCFGKPWGQHRCRGGSAVFFYKKKTSFRPASYLCFGEVRCTTVPRKSCCWRNKWWLYRSELQRSPKIMLPSPLCVLVGLAYWTVIDPRVVSMA